MRVDMFLKHKEAAVSRPIDKLMAVQQLEMKELLPSTDTESLLLGCLTAEPTHIDEVRRKCEMPMSVVSSTPAMMELKGLVKQVGGMNYILAHEAREEYRIKVE